MMEYWNIGMGRGAVSHHPNIPKPSIPTFHHSIIPIARSAKFLLLLLLLLLLLVPFPLQAVIIDKIAAIVNQDVVTQSELFAMEKLNLHLSSLPRNTDLLPERIDHHLVLQQMLKQPPVALPQDTVEIEIQVYSEKHGGMDGLAQFLSSIGMNYADFEVEVRDQIRIKKFIEDRFRPFVNVTIEEAEKYYETIYKPRLEGLGKEVPPFPESFNQIQILLAESQINDRVKAWLEEIRATASIYTKD